MKKIIIMIFMLMLLPAVLAINIDVEKHSSDEVMIIGLDEPATFNISVTNNGVADSFLFYAFFGLGLEPTERVNIENQQTKNILLKMYPREDFEIRGISTFDYFIQGMDSTEVSNKLSLNIIDLEGAFEIGSGEVDPESNSLQIYIHNKVNFDFKELTVDFSSAFFEFEETFSLGPNERKDFEISLDQKDFSKLVAGFYTLEAKVFAKDLEADLEGRIKFIEKNILETTKKSYGFFISTKRIEKQNKGNLIEETQTIIKKNIFSRLFTTFNPEPSLVNREGLSIYYTWHEEINPGEVSQIVVKTNWLIPFLIILLIIVIVVFTKKALKTDLILRKRISFVKAKGGEFALKVSIMLEANDYLEKVKVSERLPPLVKLYESYGGDIPFKIDHLKKRLEWNFENLEQGERRILSYIIYSKVGVLGRFALPPTRAMFEKMGKIFESSSNKAFFVAEQKGKEKDF